VIRAARFAVRALLAGCLLVGCGAATASAQSAAAADLKAALLINFARFALWPDITEESSLTFCILGDDRIADALSASIRGQKIDKHALAVSRLAADAPPVGCQVLFVSGSELRRGTPLLEAARLLPVLTVSDGSKFARSSGMIELFVESGRIRFAVNVEAVQRSKLTLSSRLLGLAKVVRDESVQ
jgi:hypothetical protein